MEPKTTLENALIRAVNQIEADDTDLRVIARELMACCVAVDTQLSEHTGKLGLIIPACATMFEVTTQQIRGEARGASIVEARMVAMWLTRKYCRKSFQEIGAMFQRDHTTVIHACRTVEARMIDDTFFAGQVHLVEKSLEKSAAVLAA